MKRTARFFMLLITLLLIVPPVAAYSVKDGAIIDASGAVIELHGVNWFGFETQNHVLHGLWARNWQDMITQMQSVGFNAVRLPVCPATLQGAGVDSIDYAKNPDLQGLNALQILDKVMAEFAARGMYVLLDHHRPDCNAISTLWYTDSYSEQQWLADLAFMAERYRDNPALVGIDLKNEPHGAATWGTGDAATDWKAAAERAAAAVLEKNPAVLVFVEGVETNPTCSGDLNHWWGGNLEPVRCAPPQIAADKLVFSPHVYGPDVYAQPYFQAADFPANLPAIWDAHFGFLTNAGYVVAPGEFGGRYGHGGDVKDKLWQDALVDYFLAKGIRNFFYWSWNPNSGDTGGVLQDDWQTLWDDKVVLLQRLMGGEAPPAPLEPSEPEPEPAPEPTPEPLPVATELLGSSSDNLCSLYYQLKSHWQDGLVGEFVLRNQSSTPIEAWSLHWGLRGGQISNFWSMSLFGQGEDLQTGPLSWNRAIPAGGEIVFGFQAGHGGAAEVLLHSLSCNADDAYTGPPATEGSADYQAGLAAGKALCQSDPAACGIEVPNCTDSARYAPDSGALYLPTVSLTGMAEDAPAWEVYLQQQGDGLLFEVRGLHEVKP